MLEFLLRKPKKRTQKVDIEHLSTDREAFNAFVYTPLPEATSELKKRRKDLGLERQVSTLLDNDVPSQFQEEARLTLLRYLITPNHEILRFLQLTHEFDDLRPLLCEYTEDKFIPSNQSKRLLGKLTFFKQRSKDGSLETERISIIDFETALNKKLSEIRTVWGESLTEFHHQFFDIVSPSGYLTERMDISEWYGNHGLHAKDFYFHMLLLFVRHGILFENYLLQDKHESWFIRDVFLPAFIRVQQLTGNKPLIVALEPTDIEGDKFWLCYPLAGKSFVETKMS